MMEEHLAIHLRVREETFINSLPVRPLVTTDRSFKSMHAVVKCVLSKQIMDATFDNRFFLFWYRFMYEPKLVFNNSCDTDAFNLLAKLGSVISNVGSSLTADEILYKHWKGIDFI